VGFFSSEQQNNEQNATFSFIIGFVHQMHKLIESLASTFKKFIQARTSCKVNLKILSALACQQNSHLIKASKDTSWLDFKKDKFHYNFLLQQSEL
jgi:hypothetical protein